MSVRQSKSERAVELGITCLSDTVDDNFRKFLAGDGDDHRGRRRTHHFRFARLPSPTGGRRGSRSASHLRRRSRSATVCNNCLLCRAPESGAARARVKPGHMRVQHARLHKPLHFHCICNTQGPRRERYQPVYACEPPRPWLEDMGRSWRGR